MVLDPATLVVVACIMSLVMGALLLFSWLQDRRIEALRWWSAACLVAALASALFLAGGREMWSVFREVGNAVFMLAYGLSYVAARRFNDQSSPWVAVFTGAAIWLVGVWLIDINFVQRVVLMSLLISGYALATARVLWTGPDRLMSQRAAAVVTGMNGVYFLGRVVAGPGLLPSFGWTEGFDQAWVSMVGLVTLLYAMIFGFLVMSMAKEKTDLEHRRAALIDPLTGVANRRSFMVTADTMLSEARQAGEPAAVVMFDLDHFKAVNDTYGHLAGDGVLTEFATIAINRLPRRAMLCRMGGEEFAAILPGSDHVSALDVAERIRVDLGAATRRVPATVSAGVAMSPASRESLAELLSLADDALYNAKKAGRNRVVASMGSGGRVAPSKVQQPALDAALA